MERRGTGGVILVYKLASGESRVAPSGLVFVIVSDYIVFYWICILTEQIFDITFFILFLGYNNISSIAAVST